jgi:two-component system response regulator NreC
MKALKTEDSTSSINEAVLSPKELSYLSMVSKGMSSTEIADKMFVSVRTVETWREKIIRRAQAKKIIEVVSEAIRSGLI